ncbi:hypothetical protein JCM8097_008026, partial [Rhodosporidiobolus ruineniae]
MPTASPSSSRSSPPFSAHPQAAAAHSTLLALFSSRFSSAFLASCIEYHLAHPAPAGNGRKWASEELVGAVTDKLLPSGSGAAKVEEWGREEVVGWLSVAEEGEGERERGGIKDDEAVRRRWEKGKGKEREQEGELGARKSGGGGRREDVTLARNLALIRLHTLFPLVPILELRLLLLSLEHSFLYLVTDELLQRAADSRRPRRAGGGGLEAELAAVGKTLVSAIRGLFSPSSSPSRSKNKLPIPAPDTPPPPPPVLTPHDLFRPPSHTAALTTHFQALFPSLAAGEIERKVSEEGGAYGSLRAAFEVEAAERAAGEAARRDGGGARGRGGGKFWAALGGLFASPSLAIAGPSTAPGRGGEMDDVRRAGLARAALSGCRAARREVEAYERAANRRRVRKEEARTPEADDGPLRAEETVECQCCFSDIARSAAVYCSPLLSSAAASTTTTMEAKHPPHPFCTACLAALVRTYTSGGSPLPQLTLECGAVPCFAASSSSSAGTDGAAVSAAALRKALSPTERRALERRVAEANLEAVVAASELDGGAGGPRVRVRVQKCPFCPYAELSSSSSASDGEPNPLSRVFFPAWTSAAPLFSLAFLLAVLRTLVGLPLLLLAAAVVALFALLCPFDVPRLTRFYGELYPPSPAAPPGPTTALSLPLSTTLLLAPHSALPLALAYLRHLTARVLRRKDGRRTVFRCRNLAIRGGKSGSWGRTAGGGEGGLERMEKVGERVREWVEAGEPGDGGEAGEGEEGEVEERRRRKVVELVWGDEGSFRSGGEEEEDGAPKEEEEEEREDACGRLSCLLCSLALNPSAPSLHTCLSPSSSSSSSSGEANDQQKAEESLRLALERAMTRAAGIECGRCGAGVVKEGGCNK